MMMIMLRMTLNVKSHIAGSRARLAAPRILAPQRIGAAVGVRSERLPRRGHNERPTASEDRPLRFRAPAGM
jgi:hypothetical protein